jgi:hypothetical protein
LGALFSSTFSGFFLSRTGGHLLVPFLEESVSLVENSVVPSFEVLKTHRFLPLYTIPQSENRQL